LLIDRIVDLETCGLFSRFAINSSASNPEAYITPIASVRLQHKDRWKQKTFTYPPRPLVFDLTTNVLGPSEGFSKEGCVIHSGIGFDESHVTWKVGALNLRLGVLC
jgi:hypothetical protein